MQKQEPLILTGEVRQEKLPKFNSLQRLLAIGGAIFSLTTAQLSAADPVISANTTEEVDLAAIVKIAQNDSYAFINNKPTLMNPMTGQPVNVTDNEVRIANSPHTNYYKFETKDHTVYLPKSIQDSYEDLNAAKLGELMFRATGALEIDGKIFYQLPKGGLIAENTSK